MNYFLGWKFSEIVTRTFANSGNKCDQVIKKSWKIFRTMGQNPQGLEKLNEIFHLCDKSKLNTTDDVSSLVQWLTDGWGYLAMIDYRKKFQNFFIF